MYVVTLDNTTGALVKIEALDDETGKRKELSRAQYAQAVVSGGAMGLPLATGTSRYASSPLFAAISTRYMNPYAGEPGFAAAAQQLGVSPFVLANPYAWALYGAMSGYPYAYAANGNPAAQAYFQGMMDYLQHCVGSS